ncbi:MAG: heat-inducible transcriptional repressor HrcA, partial [Ruminococcus sp.]|nr:heat-inducible transcriptional repressor HrcA [Ruminococcus sp.]
MEPAARKQKILSAIVERYIRSGEPVGSKSLLADAGLKVSSATVRNDMAELTEKGYIAQPHTSAGRVPTELGYRYYVDNVMQLTPVSEHGRATIRDTLSAGADSPESILQCAAELLTRLTGGVALTTTPDGDGARVRRISFVSTGAHGGMAVVIASNGAITTRLFRCEFLLTPEILHVFDKALNDTFAGVLLSSVNRPFVQTAAAGFGELSLFMTSPL